MNFLPDELLPRILSFVPWRELLPISAVNTTFRNQSLRPFKDLRKDQLQKILDVIVSSHPTHQDIKAPSFRILPTQIEEAVTFVEVHKHFERQIYSLVLLVRYSLLSLDVVKQATASLHLSKIIEKLSEKESFLWRPGYLTHHLFKLAVEFEHFDNVGFRSDEEKRAVVSSVFKDCIYLKEAADMAERAISFLPFDDAKKLCLESDLDEAQQQELFYQVAVHLYNKGKCAQAYSFAEKMTLQNELSDELFSFLSGRLCDIGMWDEAKQLAKKILDKAIRESALNDIQSREQIPSYVNLIPD